MRPRAAVAGAAVLALLVTGCGSGADGGNGGPQVVTGFYPLEYLAERVGGDLIDVSSLAQPGAEPHDLELSPRQIEAVSTADLVLYLAGFQPAVDDALAAGSADSLDLLEATDVSDGYQELGHDDDEGEHRSVDPHVWLDPLRYAELARAVADRLAADDPDNASAYQRNGDALAAELAALDEEFTTGLRGCERNEIVTTHNAFGYLAAKYGLEQVGIAGLAPDDEPSPQDLDAVREFAEENGVTTIFYEEAVSPEYAETVADQVGADVAVLSPLEVVDEGEDYFSVMRQNLGRLQAALGCR